MRKGQAVNTFNQGLVMDINPLVMPNDTLCNALNATIITRNGNENVLQNDMGNGRVETAYLPDGYVPIGTTEFGGIIYIVSYNPLIDKCQIGCFPSPERNITTEEVSDRKISVSDSQFRTNGKIVNQILKVKLLNLQDSSIKLNPGDKYSIYSTNNGISENSKCISDVGNIQHIVDTDPRNVTIHVVSIGDDGKIVYLDDSLVWTNDNGNPQNYYIRELKSTSGNDILKDLDSYRTLVSSAYNVFQSKVSGELALLFELKLIDTFSATWDASVSDNSGADSNKYDKIATIWFNINYTSDHKNINPKYTLLTKSQIQGSLQAPDNISMTSSDLGRSVYCELPELTDRKNDGTDTSIKISVGDFKYNSNSLDDCIWNYELTPAMSFGYMDYLSRSGSINFLEIGSGNIIIDEWRYFINDNNFNLNWGLSAYPEKNKKIKQVVMTFIPFDSVLDDEFNLIESTGEQYGDLYPQYIVSGKDSFSGYFQEQINFGPTTKIINGILSRDYLYLVDICIYYGDNSNNEFRHNYKWLYTTGQYNQQYIDNKEKLFDTLTLDGVIDINANIEYKDNIEKQTQIIIPNIELKEEFNQSNQPYELMTSRITTVNYNDTEFDTNSYSISGEVSTSLKNYDKLFSLQMQSSDKYEYSLQDKYITIDDVTPTSDIDSGLATYVVSKVKDPIENLDSDLSSTIETIRENNISNSNIDDKAVDQFSTQLFSNNDQFNINVSGVIFSRINADIRISNVNVSQTIKPLLCYKTDYNKLGLTETGDFYRYYTLNHGDGGGGKPFYFVARKLTSYGGSVEGRYNSADTSWDPKDQFSITNWWDNNPAYVNGLNVYMMDVPGPFKILQDINNSDNPTYYGRTLISGRKQFYLWAKTDNGHHIPIDCFHNSASNIPGSFNQGQFLSLLYAQIYYVDETPFILQKPIVTNINYMTNYNEYWNFTMKSQLSIKDLSQSIFLTDKNQTTTSIRNLYDKASNLGLSINNLKFKQGDKPINMSDTKFSHKFYIQNSALYNTYEEFKAVSIPALLYLSTSETPQVSIAKSPNVLYVYNDSLNTLTNLNSTTSPNLYLSGKINNSSDGRVIISELSEHSEINNIFNAFIYQNGEILLSEDKLTQVRVSMEFQTGAQGNPKSTISNNSGYGLGKFSI